jgi:Coenzyme PQQ synthesis protein D (PqqD)
MYRFAGVYYIMAGACINQRAETKREPEVWRLRGRRQDVGAREPHTSSWPNIGLNEVGTRMWRLLHQYSALQKVFERMQDEYEIAPEILKKDLLHLVDQLCAKGLVRVSRP